MYRNIAQKLHRELLNLQVKLHRYLAEAQCFPFFLILWLLVLSVNVPTSAKVIMVGHVIFSRHKDVLTNQSYKYFKRNLPRMQSVFLYMKTDVIPE